DVVAENMTSVESGRTMEEIASGKAAVWHSNRAPKTKKSTAASRVEPPSSDSRISSASLEPMYASIGSDIPGDGWTFEPKYDGVRVLAYATPSDVKLVTRNGKDKAKQFPEIVASLKKLASQTKRPRVLDGETVAPIDGAPARFQEIQSSTHGR